MFSNGDHLTETIAHFIGHFDTAIEQMRLRHDYERFAHDAPPPPDSTLQAPALNPFAAPDVPVGYVPGVEHAPHYQARDAALDALLFRIDPPIIDIPVVPPPMLQPGFVGFQGNSPATSPEFGAPPPSLIFVTQQHKFLFDNDVVVIGGYDGPLPVPTDTRAAVDALTAQAGAVTHPFTSINLEMSTSGLAPWVAETMQASAETQAPTAAGEQLSGVWVDGQTATVAPELADALPAAWQESDEDEPALPSTDAIIIDASVEETVMHLEAGGNLSVNQAAIFNAGLSGTVVAVAGDTHDMNVIVQVNAMRDTDTVADDFPVARMSDNPSKAVNIASFVSQTKDAAAEKAEADPDAMPSNWRVTIVEDDLIFFEWIYQYNFTWDNDCIVATAMGTTTTVSTGANVGLNSVSFADLGTMYDLILVGGNFYDANYICQTNILYDNDTFTTLTALGSDDGGISTNGNLLWNQALIENIGPATWTKTMPGHYSDAMEQLDHGAYAMPMTFGSDGNFAGYELLNVLYVKGNIFDINYIEQTNIISDSDQVALYAQSLDKSAQWTVETGANAAVNVASIVDYDSNGAVWYVDGETYSQAMLIQANIVETDTGAPPGEVPLANEVIAFLDNDDAPSNSYSENDPIVAPTFGPTTDVMDSVLA